MCIFLQEHIGQAFLFPSVSSYRAAREEAKAVMLSEATAPCEKALDAILIESLSTEEKRVCVSIAAGRAVASGLEWIKKNITEGKRKSVDSHDVKYEVTNEVLQYV
jgi:hypothetical protein